VDQGRDIARQVVDGRLLVVPDCGHEVPSLRPSLLNEACGLFYRTTEAAARRRAGLDDSAADGDTATPVRQAPTGAPDREAP
jgi:hypothetical protein